MPLTSIARLSTPVLTATTPPSCYALGIFRFHVRGYSICLSLSYFTRHNDLAIHPRCHQKKKKSNLRKRSNLIKMIKTKPFPTIIPFGVKKTPKNRDVYPASSSPPRPAPDADEEGQADRETEQGPCDTRRSPADHPRHSGRGAHVDVAEPLLLSAPGMCVANGPGNRLPSPRHPGEGGRAPGGPAPGKQPAVARPSVGDSLTRAAHSEAGLRPAPGFRFCLRPL